MAALDDFGLLILAQATRKLRSQCPRMGICEARLEPLVQSQISGERTTDTAKPTVGLRHWMERVLEECNRASSEFAADPVHDLRVALRRCRSMADGLMVIDPSPSWKNMKRAAGRLFRSLGALRDVQVMSEWVRRLGQENDPESTALLTLLGAKESEQKTLAAAALREFDVKQWRRWSRQLPLRAMRVKVGSQVFKHLALERWTEAYELHRQALRNRSQVAFHRLRIGIKRLRYIVENFLPQQHEAWSSDLKELQDLLGEVHDLDVLWTTAQRVNAFAGAESRFNWRARLQTERSRRIARYRERMLGPKSLWRTWRAELPQGDQIQAAAMARMRLWASYLDPDVRHSRHVAALARQLFDGLAKMGLADGQPRLRAMLAAAALVHDVGLAKHDKNHHKISSRMIRKLVPPLGWSAEDLNMLATIARFHRGALPHARHKSYRGLMPEQRRTATLLAAILRFADAFDDTHDGRVHSVRLEEKDGFLLVSAAGYAPLTRTGQDVAAARHLLEIVMRKPILVRPLRQPVRSKNRTR